MELSIRIEDLETLVDAVLWLERAQDDDRHVPAAIAHALEALSTITATVQQDADEAWLERLWGAD